MGGEKLREVDDYLSIRDFSPGIHQRPSPNVPPGAATLENTYRCMSHQGGILGPAPKLVDTINGPLSPADILEAGDTFLSEEFRISGIMANDPVFSTETEAGTDQSNTELYVAIEYWITDDSDADDDHLWLTVWRYSHHEGATAEWELVWDEDIDKGPTGFDPDVRPKRCWFMQGRSNSADNLQSGPICVAWVYDGWAVMFPDDTNPTVNGTVDLPGSLGDAVGNPSGLIVPADAVAHQGRIVIFPLTLTGDGTIDSVAVVYTSNENIYWTESNDWTILDPSLSSFFQTSFFFEIPTGYAVMESLTAGELLLIKAKGGGGVVRGSLNDPTAISKPLLRGAGHSQNRGTRFPGGFIYPIDAGGIEMWPGGDGTIDITPQMDGDFWRPPPVAPANGTQTATGWGYQFTGCGTFGDYVLLPNNFIMDRDSFDGKTMAVWRLEDPDTFIAHYWTVDWKQRWAWAAPSGFGDDEDVALYQFDANILADTYSYQTHPLALSEDPERMVTVREVVLEATGEGTVTITITGADGDTESQIYNLDSDMPNPDFPRAVRKGFSVTSSHVQVKIETDSGDADTPAPYVHAIHIGRNQTQRTHRGASA